MIINAYGLVEIAEAPIMRSSMKCEGGVKR